MLAPSYSLTSTERVLPRLALDFTTAVLDPRVAFTRATGASNPATYINSSGVITIATNNQPRFDYDPVTLVCKGLLIEESRTNSLLNSDTLSTQSVIVTAAARTLSFYGTGQVVLSGAHTAVVSGTGAYPTRTTYSFTPTAGALTLTVAGTVQYAQLEAGAFATSYIPTTTTALTRNADVATMTGTNFSDWFNASEGTFVNWFTTEPGTTGNLQRCGLSVSDGTTSNRMTSVINTSTAMLCLVTAGGVSQAGLAPTTTNIFSGQNKVSLGYKLNNFGACVNAGTVQIDTSGTVPTVTQAQIGRVENAAANFLNGWVQKCLYYSVRLTDSELQATTK